MQSTYAKSKFGQVQFGKSCLLRTFGIGRFAGLALLVQNIAGRNESSKSGKNMESSFLQKTVCHSNIRREEYEALGASVA